MMASRTPVRAEGRAHPIHGILSAFPLAFFVGAFVTDIVYANSADMMWANFSIWQITFGIIGGILAAIAGIGDALMNRGRRRGGSSSAHSLVTIFMMAFALVDAFVHSRDAWTSVVPTGLVLSAVTALLALASSWLGFSVLARQELR